MPNAQPRPLVLVSQKIPDAWLSALDDQCRLIVGPERIDGLPPELEPHLGEAEALFATLNVRVDEALLARAPRLKVVSNMAVGVDNVDLAACTRRGLPVGHTPGVLTDSTADLTLALLLAAARRLPEASLDAREGRWSTWTPTGWLGADLKGATLGIVGLGKIGQAVAERARAFGLRLIYHSRRPKPDVEARLSARRVTFDALLRDSDFVSLHVPLTDETRGLINADALRAMRPTSILINAARGSVVDTAALERALREGWIGGAALDVTDPEPLPATHPLYALPNCFIVPHVGSATAGTRRAMAELAGENVLAGLEGRRLRHCANPEVYEANTGLA